MLLRATTKATSSLATLSILTGRLDGWTNQSASRVPKPLLSVPLARARHDQSCEFRRVRKAAVARDLVLEFGFPLQGRTQVVQPRKETGKTRKEMKAVKKGERKKERKKERGKRRRGESSRRKESFFLKYRISCLSVALCFMLRYKPCSKRRCVKSYLPERPIRKHGPNLFK